jgi:signal transduction histidine kinase
LKSENVDESTTIEIEKILSDYKPLQTVSQNWLRTHIRKERDIVEETLQSYLSSIPLFKNIEFTFEGPKLPIFVMLNPTLHSWTIENLVKNAIDAMKGRGKLALKEQDHDSIKISVTDSGMEYRRNNSNDFEPGFTTKKEAGD